jgi:nucleoside-diphosphate kinase
MVKPDAVDQATEIIDMARRQGFTVVANRTRTLTPTEAALFYREHSRRPFFPGLVQFMSSGPVMAIVFERDDAVVGWRDLMGPTNSVKARKCARATVRAKYGTDGQRNAVHGSDSCGSAKREIDFFFGKRSMIPLGARVAFDRLFALLGVFQLPRRRST